MSNIILQAKALSKTYRDGASKIEVLKSVDLAISAGEMVAIVGTSGSGKSTLLQLLGGLDKPTSGQVLLKDHDLHRLHEKKKCEYRNRYLGFIYQFHHLLPEFTALENVAMPLLIRDDKDPDIVEKAKVILQQVGLEKRLKHRLSQLSGGERQRVAIARALITKPLCVLADEPTGNLDPKNAEVVFELFLELQKSYQASVVMVTHDMKIAKRADRIFTIESGDLRSSHAS